MLPAYFGNMAPVIMKNHFKFLAVPIDKSFPGSTSWFGSHKTWRGLFLAPVFGVITAYLQFVFNISSLNLIDYSHWLIIGVLLGTGAILGDLIKSFIKRRLKIAPGKKFIPFDQIDFVMGALLLSWYIVPSLKVAVTLLIISPLLHIIVNHIAFYLKIRGEAW